MSRPATGAIKWKKDPDGNLRWHGRVQLRDGSRPFVPLDPDIKRHEEERARACAVSTAAYYRDRHVTSEELEAELNKTSTSQLERHITSLFNRLPLRNRLDLASGLMASVTREIHPHEDPNPELPL